MLLDLVEIHAAVSIVLMSTCRLIVHAQVDPLCDYHCTLHVCGCLGVCTHLEFPCSFLRWLKNLHRYAWVDSFLFLFRGGFLAPTFLVPTTPSLTSKTSALALPLLRTNSYYLNATFIRCIMWRILCPLFRYTVAITITFVGMSIKTLSFPNLLRHFFQNPQAPLSPIPILFSTSLHTLNLSTTI